MACCFGYRPSKRIQEYVSVSALPIYCCIVSSWNPREMSGSSSPTDAILTSRAHCADGYGKGNMQQFQVARCLQQVEEGFCNPALWVYPDGNTCFDVEANNDFTKFLSSEQMDTFLKVPLPANDRPRAAHLIIQSITIDNSVCSSRPVKL